MKILRLNQVQTLVPLSRTTLWRMERDGAFPHRIKIGSNSVGWLEHEVCRWIASRQQA